MLQIPLNALSKHVTPDMIPDIKGLSCYAPDSDKLTVQSNEYGRQKDNLEKCYRKINESVKDIADKVVSRESDASLSGQ